MSSSPVWLITGCSSGFGNSLAHIALCAGHKIIVTSRNPPKTPDLVSRIEKLGGKWLALDITSPEAELAKVVEKATSVYGRIDIVVNNAAYALLGAFESITDEEARAQMETNFFGPMKLMRLVLPSMRERRSGTIVNISSTAGIEAGASRSMHASSKWGLEAVSESLAEEMKPQGVRVLIVEPGGFRSNFAAAVNMAKADIPKEYQGTMTDQMLTAVTMMTPEMVKLFPGDVEKGCQAILDVVTKSGRAEGDG